MLSHPQGATPGPLAAEVRAVIDHLHRTRTPYEVSGEWGALALANRHDGAGPLELRVVPEHLPGLQQWLAGRGHPLDAGPVVLSPLLTAPGERAGRLGGTRVHVADDVRAAVPLADDGLGAIPSNRTLWWCVALVLALTAAVFGIGLGMMFAGPRDETRLTVVAAVVEAVHGVGCLTTMWWLLRRDGISLRDLGFRTPTPRMLHLLWQIPVAFSATAAAQGLAMYAFGDLKSNTDPGDYPGLTTSPLAVVATILAFCVFAPLHEEIFFRGILLARLRARWGLSAAVVGSSLVFMACHVLPPLFPYIVTLGLCLALVRVFHRNLWASVVMHAANNTMATLALLVTLSR